MAPEPRDLTHKLFNLDRAPPARAGDLLAALEDAVATAKALFVLRGAALSLAGEDGTLGVVAMTDGTAELRALAVGDPGAVDVLSVPLPVDGVLVGVMDLYGAATGAWSDERVAAARAYAGVIADLLRAGIRALSDRLAGRALQPLPGEVVPDDRLAQLSGLLEALTEAPASSAVTQVVLDRGLRSLGADSGLVGRVVPDRGQVELVAWHPDRRWAAPASRRLELDAPGPLAEAAREGAAVWLSSGDDFERRYPGAIPSGPWEAQVAVGFALHGRPSGVLWFAFERVLEFDEDTRVFVHILAQQCALASERDRLFARVRATIDTSRRVQRRAADVAMALSARNVLNSEEQSVLLYEATLLTAQADEQAIIDQFAALTVPLFADWCVVYIRQPDGSLPRAAVVGAGEVDEQTLALWRRRWPIDITDDHPVAEVVRLRRPVLLPSITDEVIVRSVTDPGRQDEVRAMGLRSILFLPLDGSQECLGAVGFVSTRSAHYTSADLAFGTALAARLTTALEQARRSG
jgi:GAF domain-containing protein